jgi:hypothetical protein
LKQGFFVVENKRVEELMVPGRFARAKGLFLPFQLRQGPLTPFAPVIYPSPQGMLSVQARS